MDNVYQCGLCNKICKTARGLASHQLTHKQPTDSGDTSNVQGTPKLLLTCEVCKKQFKAEKNLQKHRKTHAEGAQNTQGTPQCTSADRNVSQESSATIFSEEEFWTDDLVEAFQQEYVDELPDLFVAEAEAEEQLRQGVEAVSVSDSSSKAKKQKKPPLVRCRVCKDPFDTIDTYLKHLMGHAMKEACSRAPSTERAKLESLLIGEKVLSSLEESRLNHAVAQEITTIAKSLKNDLYSDTVKTFFSTLCESLMSCFSDQLDCSILSKLTEKYHRHTAHQCVDLNVRKTLLTLISEYVNVNSPVANILLTSIMQKFSHLLLAFIIRVMADKKDSEVDGVPVNSLYVNRNENTGSLEFKQIMHFVGGANVRKMVNLALRLRNPNEKSENMIHVLRNNFLITDLANAPDSDLMEWTECKDRGGLLKINTKVLDLFVELGKLILPLERLNGSLLVDEIIENVCNSSCIINLWNSIICDGLDQEESFELLHEICCNFSVTLRNGIISRRADEAAAQQPQKKKHGTDGLSFRARLGW